MGSVTGTTLTRTLSYSFIQPSNNNPENLIHSENVEVGEQKDENEHLTLIYGTVTYRY